jgi:rhodanese-related sulfurtransferase
MIDLATPVIDLATADIAVQDAQQPQPYGAVSLDVREPFEFVSAHAPGALNHSRSASSPRARPQSASMPKCS